MEPLTLADPGDDLETTFRAALAIAVHRAERPALGLTFAHRVNEVEAA